MFLAMTPSDLLLQCTPKRRVLLLRPFHLLSLNIGGRDPQSGSCRMPGILEKSHKQESSTIRTRPWTRNIRPSNCNNLSTYLDTSSPGIRSNPELCNQFPVL